MRNGNQHGDSEQQGLCVESGLTAGPRVEPVL